MRRITAIGLALALLLPLGVVVQGSDETEPRDEAVYQGLWCLYLNARPYLNNVPADVVCDYERRPMTKAEAGAYYQRMAQDSNYLGSQWGCADRKSRNGLTWKQDKKWAARMRKDSKQFDRQARAVTWPTSVRKKIMKLLDLGAAYDYAQKRAYNHKDYSESYFSGDWGRMDKAGGKYSPVAQQIRTALGIPDVPDPGNECKAVKRYERQQVPPAPFANPYSNNAIARMAALLAWWPWPATN